MSETSLLTLQNNWRKLLEYRFSRKMFMYDATEKALAGRPVRVLAGYGTSPEETLAPRITVVRGPVSLSKMFVQNLGPQMNFADWTSDNAVVFDIKAESALIVECITIELVQTAAAYEATIRKMFGGQCTGITAGAPSRDDKTKPSLYLNKVQLNYKAVSRFEIYPVQDIFKEIEINAIIT